MNLGSSSTPCGWARFFPVRTSPLKKKIQPAPLLSSPLSSLLYPLSPLLSPLSSLLSRRARSRPPAAETEKKNLDSSSSSSWNLSRKRKMPLYPEFPARSESTRARCLQLQVQENGAGCWLRLSVLTNEGFGPSPVEDKLVRLSLHSRQSFIRLLVHSHSHQASTMVDLLCICSSRLMSHSRCLCDNSALRVHQLQE